MPVTIADIRDAARRIGGHVHRTPVLTCATLDRLCDARLVFKAENLQKAGAFKIRGASNAVFSLSDADLAGGVATHSSGNHGAALALAARGRGVRCTVVVPQNAPRVKKAAMAAYGAELVFCAPTLQAREEALRGVVERTGARFVHPYDDELVIAGQGTAALELLEDAPGLDLVLAPVGGGGLISGTATAVAALSPGTKVVGVEPELADDARRSLEEGRIMPPTNLPTVADGLRTALGARTFPIIRELVQEIVTVGEEEIVQAMRLVWERMKLVVEPSAAVPLAALLTGRIAGGGRRIGIILSGGNVDLDNLPWVKG